MTPNDAIAKSLETSHMLLKRFTADLTPAEYLHRTSAAANCAAWTIGHLVLTERRCLGTFGVSKLPPLPDGFEKMFGRDEGCAQAATFGDVSVLMPLFDLHREMLIETVRRATQEQLDAPLEIPRPPRFVTVGEQALFMATHVAMHAGQITLIRRSLGRPPLV